MNGVMVAFSLSLLILTATTHAAEKAPGPFLESKGATPANFLQNKLRRPSRPSAELGSITADRASRPIQSQIAKKSPSELTAIQKQSGFQYRYVSLNQFIPPEFIIFDPARIIDSKRVYGTAYACDVFCIPSIATYHQGVVKILHQNALVYDANGNGIIGGSVVLDNANFIEQAALFDNGAVKLVPRVQGEVSSRVIRITDSGLALVQSLGTSDVSYYMQKNGKSTKLNFGTNSIIFLDINNDGIIAGTMVVNSDYRAFRFNPFTGKLTLLDPLATEPSSWGLKINNQNEVLGYSFIGGALERIGVWKGDEFSTSFVEGTPQFPTVSNRLLWNNHGLIVITYASNDTTSYLVPKPGIRLNLAELVDGLPTGIDLYFISDINERGDLIGFDLNGGAFILERVTTYAEPIP